MVGIKKKTTTYTKNGEPQKYGWGTQKKKKKKKKKKQKQKQKKKKKKKSKPPYQVLDIGFWLDKCPAHVRICTVPHHNHLVDRR